MADTRISALSALTGASAASSDLAVVVDVSDTTMAASGTDKRMTLAELATAMALLKVPSRSLSDVHTDGSVVNSITETTLATLAVPTSVAAGDIVRFRFVGDLLNNSGANVTYIWRFYVGATAVLTTPALSMSNSASRRVWRADVDMLVVDVSLDQRINAYLMVGLPAPNTWSVPSAGNGIGGPGRGTSAEDLTAGKTVSISAQLNTANASADCYVHEATAEVLKR